MSAKELLKPMLYSFFIILSCALISAFVLIHFIEGVNRFTFADLVALFTIAVLTTLTQLTLYSKKPLRPEQVTFRFILIAPMVLTLAFAMSGYMGWIEYFARMDYRIVFAFVIFVVCVIFVVMIVVMSFFNEKLKSLYIMKEKDYYLHQYKVMQESMEQISAIRHDMKSHLAIMRGYASNNQEITNYLDKLLEEIEESEIYSDTGNIAFDSIINFKLARAKSDNINLDIALKIPPKLNIEATDVAIIIGNLLDNALYATSKVSERELKLEIDYSKGILYIQVDNTFDRIVNYSESKRRGEKRITTRKKRDSQGQGLKNIKRSVEVYDGHMEITHEDNWFSVRVLLYVDLQNSLPV